MKKAAMAALLLASTCWAGPNEATPPTEPSKNLSAPSWVAPATKPTSALATVQGGLVDVRYGQVSVDLGGTATVLELDKSSTLSLDGSAITAEELLKRVPDGLAAAVRYDAETGLISALDAFGGGEALPSASVKLLPWKGPAYSEGETVTVLVAPAELKRLGEGNLSLTVPGVGHGLAFMPAQGGARKVSLRVSPGTDLHDVPILLRVGQKVYRAGRLSFSTTPPQISGYGPHTASSKLASIPGWIDLRSSSRWLDPSSAKLSVSRGAKVVSFQPRADRTVFAVEADGPGEYWLEFSISDRLGRSVKQRWPLRVLP